MNKNVVELYNRALAVVLEDYELSEVQLFRSNDAECVQARMALVMALAGKLTDKEIAECTHKMRRCSICIIRNKYDDKTAPWTVKHCIEKIKQLSVIK